MSAGPRFADLFSSRFQLLMYTCADRYEYLWEDGIKFKRATKLPAPEYVDTLMNWAQSILDDEAVFPNKIGIFRTFFHCMKDFHPFDFNRCTFPSQF